MGNNPFPRFARPQISPANFGKIHRFSIYEIPFCCSIISRAFVGRPNAGVPKKEVDKAFCVSQPTGWEARGNHSVVWTLPKKFMGKECDDGMGLFSMHYDREGPGVRKDEPPKKGFARFWEILTRDYGHLFKLNLLFMLCCLPAALAVGFGALFSPYLGMLLIAAVVFIASSALIGQGMSCLHWLTVKTVRDEACYLWHEFRRCWKANWRQSVPTGILFSCLLAMNCIAARFYLFEQEKIHWVLLIFVSFSMLLIINCWLLTTLQLLFLDLPLSVMLKNSLLMLFGYAKRTLPCAVLTMVIWFLLLAAVPWPITILLAFQGLFAQLAVIADMWAWPAMEEAFHISEQQAAKRAEREALESGG